MVNGISSDSATCISNVRDVDIGANDDACVTDIVQQALYTLHYSLRKPACPYRNIDRKLVA